MDTSCTLARLSEITGIPPRQLQFWTSEGLLRPEPASRHAGKGRHRRYPRAEVETVMLLAELGKPSMPIGSLQAFADQLRSIFTAGEELGYTDPDATLKELEAIRRRKKSSRLSLKDRIRLEAWASVEQARQLKDVTVLFGVYFDRAGNCEVELFARSRRDRSQITSDDLLLDRKSVLVIDVGVVLYELDGALADAAKATGPA